MTRTWGFWLLSVVLLSSALALGADGSDPMPLCHPTPDHKCPPLPAAVKTCQPWTGVVANPVPVALRDPDLLLIRRSLPHPTQLANKPACAPGCFYGCVLVEGGPFFCQCWCSS